VPAGTPGITDNPWDSVMSVRFAPVSVFVRVIVAPGMTAPDGSLTVTFSVASCWPTTLLDTRHTSTTVATDQDEVRFIVISPFCAHFHYPFLVSWLVRNRAAMLRPLLQTHA